MIDAASAIAPARFMAALFANMKVSPASPTLNHDLESQVFVAIVDLFSQVKIHAHVATLWTPADALPAPSPSKFHDYIDILEYSHIYRLRGRRDCGRMAKAETLAMQNVGTPDRIARLIIGALLIAAPFLTGWPIWASALAFWAAIIVGVVLLATAVFSFCPIYAALGLNTRGRRRA
ncbi:DUF2892 domain-containing protein [Youhaiella tibetensis]|nr:DUF2892 domain-containing protein [Youhaiella tibetensis]